MSRTGRRISRIAVRIAPIAPLTPALAVIVFAAANAAAAVVSRNALSDVQVGERGKYLRVALICEDDCRIGARANGEYFIPGVKESLNVDLRERSRHASALDFTPADGGTALSIRSKSALVASSIRRCVIDAATASCIDLEFADPAPAVAQSAAKVAPQESPKATGGPHILAAITPVGDMRPPPLREAPQADQLQFASLDPPERFEPPKRADDRPAEAPRPAATPAPLPARPSQLLGADFDLRATAETILGRRYSGDDCQSARARLKADAWALDAMVDIGFCDAIEGQLEEADGVFARLLAYTPDNYEALVGRALVSVKRGRPEEAGHYFQDALNALPPIAQSDRIVKAMAQL